jgi:hypothetical protein
MSRPGTASRALAEKRFPLAVPLMAAKHDEREGFEDVDDGSGVRTGARQGVISRELVKHSAAFQKMVPCHQSTIRRECCVAAAQVKLPARRQEFEIQPPFTQWVNQ